ncbi:MAG TPA: hypothetical protein VI488_22245 [Candidatus Angelobacter sp.]
MTDATIREAHDAYGKMVSGQVARITSELNRLDQLLKAGRVDARVLREFRHAVDRVRTSGWQVQVWLEGDAKALSLVLMEERIRLATRLAQQLASEISAGAGEEFLGLGSLRDAIDKLDQALGGPQ